VLRSKIRIRFKPHLVRQFEKVRQYRTERDGSRKQSSEQRRSKPGIGLNHVNSPEMD
jgi:hypothetical protein